ncbi:MAG: FixH family protein [Leptospirillia bacterium]
MPLPNRFLNNLTSAALAIALALVIGCTPAAEQEKRVGNLTVGVRTDPSPAELGDNTITFFVTRDGAPLTDGIVRFRMFMAGMPMSTDTVWINAPHTKRGRYTGVGDFSMGGEWQVEVSVETASGEPVQATFPYTIRWELK